MFGAAVTIVALALSQSAAPDPAAVPAGAKHPASPTPMSQPATLAPVTHVTAPVAATLPARAPQVAPPAAVAAVAPGGTEHRPTPGSNVFDARAPPRGD